MTLKLRQQSSIYILLLVISNSVEASKSVRVKITEKGG